jgi:hypothetical protein
VIAEGRTIDDFKHDRWARRMAAGDIVPAMVRSVTATSAQLRIGTLQGQLTRTGIQRGADGLQAQEDEGPVRQRPPAAGGEAGALRPFYIIASWRERARL